MLDPHYLKTMKKLFLILALSLQPLALLLATPLQFTAVSMTGSTNDITINFTAVNNPVIWNGNFYWLPPGGTNLTTTNGVGYLSLIPGKYNAYITGLAQSWQLNVTNSATLVNAANLPQNLTFYSGVQTLTGTNGITVTMPSPGNLVADASAAKAAILAVAITNNYAGNVAIAGNLTAVTNSASTALVGPGIEFDSDGGSGTYITVGGAFTAQINGGDWVIQPGDIFTICSQLDIGSGSQGTGPYNISNDNNDNSSFSVGSGGQQNQYGYNHWLYIMDMQAGMTNNGGTVTNYGNFKVTGTLSATATTGITNGLVGPSITNALASGAYLSTNAAVVNATNASVVLFDPINAAKNATNGLPATVWTLGTVSGLASNSVVNMATNALASGAYLPTNTAVINATNAGAVLFDPINAAKNATNNAVFNGAGVLTNKVVTLLPGGYFITFQTNAAAFNLTNLVPPGVAGATNWGYGTFTNGTFCAWATNIASGGFLLKQLAP